MSHILNSFDLLTEIKIPSWELISRISLQLLSYKGCYESTIDSFNKLNFFLTLSFETEDN